jgi:hypothetical protein
MALQQHGETCAPPIAKRTANMFRSPYDSLTRPANAAVPSDLTPANLKETAKNPPRQPLQPTCTEGSSTIKDSVGRNITRGRRRREEFE